MSTTTIQTPYRQLGHPTREAFRAELAAVNSPLLADADSLWEATKPHGRLFLGHAWRENRHSTTGILIDVGMFNPLALRPRNYPEEAGERNGYAVFRSHVDCVNAWFRRWDDPNLTYHELPADAPLIDYITIFHPPGDTHIVTGEANAPRQYATVVTEVANRLRVEDLPSAARQRVVVVPGHRGVGDPGSREEASLTPALARAYVAALRAAGHVAWYLPEHDADTMPDNTQGGLDGVGQATRALCAAVDATAMLDVHYEGSNNTQIRGLFAVVPNVTGLVTRVSGGAPPDDTIANNARDVELARAISRRLSEATDIPRRMLGAPGELGVMSETQTWVGTGSGGEHAPSRLAMFAYTAGVRATCVRLVIEHGALTNQADRALILRQDFTQRCAAGLVRAFADVFGGTDTSTTETTPLPTPAPGADLGWFPGMNLGIAEWLFGELTLADGQTAGFNPAGPLSRAWFAHGRETGEWPAAGGTDEFSGKIRAFDDGDGNVREYVRIGDLVYWRANAREGFRLLASA